MTTESNNFRSRFGYHVCDFETYVKLKLLHRWYWQTVRDFHGWWRWQRKLPHNRQGTEPAYCPVFVENRPWHQSRRSHGQEAVRRYPKTLVDRGVLAWFRTARTPQIEPPPLLDEVSLREIDRLFGAAEAWFSRS